MNFSLRNFMKTKQQMTSAVVLNVGWVVSLKDLDNSLRNGWIHFGFRNLLTGQIRQLYCIRYSTNNCTC